MVRRSHDDAVLVGEFRVQRIVIVESIVPHRRPEVVCFQAQEQLEYLLVELMIVVAELFSHPARKRGRFIVEKDAAVLHGRLVLQITARADEQLIVMRYRNVSPPIPGRHANLFRQIVETIDRATFVAADNNQSTSHSGPGLRHNLNNERLPTTADRRRIEFASTQKLADQTILSQRAHDNELCRLLWSPGDDRWPDPADSIYIRLQIARGSEDAGVILRVHDDRRRCAVARETYGSRSRRKLHVARLTKSKD